MMLQTVEERGTAHPLVVITRPEEQARPIAATLEALGYATLIEPMLDIVWLKAELPPLGSYDALAFTSANGARAFAAQCSERNLPAYAVGETTAGALRLLGFRTICEAQGDSLAVATLIRATVGAGGRVLHVSGRAIARDLGELLAPAGIALDRVPLYDAIPAQSLSMNLVSALYARTVEFVLFLSARTARTFGTLVDKNGYASMTTSSTALCLSDAVAAASGGLPWQAVRVAAEPTVASLLALLSNLPGAAGNGQ
jgi:uroporphyrinogen-III synthase